MKFCSPQARTCVFLATALVLSGCRPAAEITLYTVAGALRPHEHGPPMCAYNPVRAYIERHDCKDERGQLLPSPIDTANVNTAYEGVCALDMAMQANRLDVFDEAWTKGASPEKCETNNFYNFLVSECRSNPQATMALIDATLKQGWLSRPQRAQALLEASVAGPCFAGFEVALAHGARARHSAIASDFKGKSLYFYASTRVADSYNYRSPDMQNMLRRLLTAGACPDALDTPPVKLEAAEVFNTVRREVCGT
jgi:hypothetical protein